MAYLANPTETRNILNTFGFSFKKKFGQNFLIDRNIVEKIVTESGITKNDTVLEIGPGIGTMTQVLCEYAKNVVAVEIDTTLMTVLDYTLSEYDNVNVINEDILKCNIREIKDKYANGRPLKVVANLPYYITTPIIMELIENNTSEDISSVTIMIQKEVAERLSAHNSTKDYGAITLAVNYYTQSSMIMTVPASCFMPRPNVDSAVIRLDVYDEPPIKSSDDRFMFKVIKASFAQRRKTLINSVSATLNVSKDTIKTALNESGIPEGIRGEALTLEQFALFSDNLRSKLN